MRKIGTNTQSMIFTIYGDYIRNYGSKIWIGSLIRLLKEFGHNEQGVRVAVSRMVKQGWIQSEKQGNKSYYFLTDRGVQRMDEAANRIYKMKPNEWDGKWRILMYTIPEDKRQLRDDLRKELLWSGFGSFSSGFDKVDIMVTSFVPFGTSNIKQSGTLKDCSMITGSVGSIILYISKPLDLSVNLLIQLAFKLNIVLVL